jgi:hypothetical protein
LESEELILPFCNRAAKGEGVGREVGSRSFKGFLGKGEERHFEGSNVEVVVEEDLFSGSWGGGGSVRHRSGEEAMKMLMELVGRHRFQVTRGAVDIYQVLIKAICPCTLIDSVQVCGVLYLLSYRADGAYLAYLTGSTWYALMAPRVLVLSPLARHS